MVVTAAEISTAVTVKRAGVGAAEAVRAIFLKVFVVFRFLCAERLEIMGHRGDGFEILQGLKGKTAVLAFPVA